LSQNYNRVLKDHNYFRISETNAVLEMMDAMSIGHHVRTIGRICLKHIMMTISPIIHPYDKINSNEYKNKYMINNTNKIDFLFKI